MSDIDKENNKEFQKLETLINETYGAKAQEPMPDKTKKLLESYQKKTSFKLFGLIGLAPLAAFGWLGTISLGSLQIMGYMAVTQAPQTVFRGSGNIFSGSENMQNSVNISAYYNCLLYTSPSPRDGLLSRMPSSA